MFDETMSENLDPRDQETAELLAGLRPASAAAARDGLMFAAGARRAKRSLWAWRGVAAGLAVVTSLSILLRPSAPAARLVTVPVTPAVQDVTVDPSIAETSGPYTAASLTALGIQDGVDALPLAAPARGGRGLSNPTPSLRPDSNFN